MSPSSKGSPHSGQNLGGWVGSAGSQPHLSHLYCGTPAGFFAPHSAQNLPLFTAPQAQTQPSAWASGFFVPHSGQNFPVAEAPHCGHFQPSPAGFGSGFLLPQLGQKLPVIPPWPQAQVQQLAAGGGGGGAGCGTGCCATAAAARLSKRSDAAQIRLIAEGGTLIVKIEEDGNLLLSGGAQKICSGTFLF